MHLIISSKELCRMQEAIAAGEKEIEASLDLGLTTTKIKLGNNGLYPGKKLVEIPKIRDGDNSSYILLKNQLEKVQFFSPETNILYKLIPTSYRPILQCSGTSMHKKEFVERVEADKLTGKVLDAGTGLGYTAIAASKTATEVLTIEKDKNVIQVAKFNPYSQELFLGENIKRLTGNIVQKITAFSDEEFDFIIFDAGTPKSSDDFFSLKNYQQAYRVLKRSGRLYHYLPKHHVQRGRDFGGEAIERMRRAGFRLIERKVEESYVVMGK
ncbi:methyltransferase domain-containing protein [Candidatus Woesearchaeota archaeon]|nr:methyltransferase domain-containing protein [Candidatus Woesearchaeota archaeon]